jgi:hypothetical protein
MIKIKYIILILSISIILGAEPNSTKSGTDSFWNMSAGAGIAISTSFVALLAAIIGIFKMFFDSKKKSENIITHTPENCTIAIPIREDIKIIMVKLETLTEKVDKIEETLTGKIDKIDKELHNDIEKNWDIIEKLRDHILSFLQVHK